MIFFRILELAGPDRPNMLRAIICKVLESLFASVPLGIAYLAIAALMEEPYAMSVLPLPVGQPMGVLLIAALLLLAYGGQWLFFWLSSIQAYSAGYRIAARLRMQLARHARDLPSGYYHKRDTGELANVLMQDVMALEQVPGLVLPRLVAALSFPVFAIVLSFALDWRMGLALIAGLPFAIPALVWGHRGLKRVSQEHSAKAARMNGKLIEFIRGIDVIKTFGLTEEHNNTCIRAVGDFREVSKALTFRYVVPTIIFPVCLLSGSSIALLLGADLLQSGELSPASYLMFFLIGLRLYGPLLDLMDFSSLVRQMENALSRILEVLNVKREDDAGKASIPQGYGVTFENVSFAYGDTCNGQVGINNISFVVPEGSVTAFVGETGAGKSTIAKLLCRQYDALAGRILIDGVLVSDIPRNELHRIVGVVSQDVFLFSETIRDNLRLGCPDVSDAEIIAATRAARCHEFIAKLPDGYDTILEGGGNQLSGGERQRLSLARAFLRDSRILILDEVTSALDVENERLVQEALSELVRDRTVIVIAHRLWTVKDADQIILLENGKIRERGTHDQLLDHGAVYSGFWQQLRNAPGWGGKANKAA
jgi:ABC-type multidrug transport system fused ATPase/permease subunit